MPYSLILFLSCSLNALFGQEDAADNFYTNASQEVCACYSQFEASPERSRAVFGTYLVVFLSDNIKTYEALFGPLEFGNKAALCRLEERIVLKPAKECPESFVKIDRSSLNKAPVSSLSPKINSSFISGTITGLEGKEVALVTLRSLEGINYTFCWLKQFPGAELVTDLQKRGRFPVEIEYETQKIYTPTRQEYVPRRVIVAIRVLE